MVPAVAIGPPALGDPVFLFPFGSASLTPSGTRQAKSPVFAPTAIKPAQGGLKHGKFATVRPLASFEATKIYCRLGSTTRSLNLDVGPSQLGPADSIGPVHQERKPSLHSTFGFRDRLVGDDCRVRAQAGFGRRRTLTVSVPRRQKRFDHALASCRHRLRRFDKRNNGYAVLWT